MDINAKYIFLGVGGMVVGGVLVVIGLLQIPVMARVLVLVGGAVGYVGNKIYKGDIRI